MQKFCQTRRNSRGNFVHYRQLIMSAGLERSMHFSCDHQTLNAYLSLALDRGAVLLLPRAKHADPPLQLAICQACRLRGYLLIKLKRKECFDWFARQHRSCEALTFELTAEACGPRQACMRLRGRIGARLG
eukprot:404058-Pleurochrysis_carterae.AAC.1